MKGAVTMKTENTGLDFDSLYAKDVIVRMSDQALQLGKIPALCVNGFRLPENGILTDMKKIRFSNSGQSAAGYLYARIVHDSDFTEASTEISITNEMLKYLLRNSVCVLQTRKDIYVISSCNDLLKFFCNETAESSFIFNNYISGVCLSKNGKHICKPVTLTLNEPYIVYPLYAVLECVLHLAEKLMDSIGIITVFYPKTNKRNSFFITNCETFYRELGIVENTTTAEAVNPIDFKGTFKLRTISPNGSRHIVFPLSRIEKIVFGNS